MACPLLYERLKSKLGRENCQLADLIKEAPLRLGLASFMWENLNLAASMAGCSPNLNEFNISVPGRFEILEYEGRKVILDYAHTPDACEKLLFEVRKTFPQSKVFTVLGCGGDRDRGKRNLMGGVAGKLSDYLIITSDNPRSEDPLAIIKDIENGVQAFARRESIVSRKDAIVRLIRLMEADCSAIGVVLGKGDEEYQEINGTRHIFSDRDEIYKEWKGAGR